MSVGIFDSSGNMYIKVIHNVNDMVAISIGSLEDICEFSIIEISVDDAIVFKNALEEVINTVKEDISTNNA